MKTSEKPFEVSFTLTVDRPELRGPSYAPVGPGTKCHTVERFATQGAAVRCFEAILRGEYDYRSEYVSSVGVTHRTGEWSKRTVRTWRTRTRFETTREYHLNTLGVAAARNGALHFAVFH